MITGIIAEYNPFHKGHKYQFDALRKNFDTAIVAVMSSNFVQRGEPSVTDKFKRTEMALLCGADVVIELPCVYSTSSADIFALGAVDIINKIKADRLCFGSEGGIGDILEKSALLLSDEPPSFKAVLKKELSKGVSYPRARLSALSEFIDGDVSSLSLPNNILALEYMKALHILKSDTQPFIIKRISSGYNDKTLSGEISSATAIRHALADSHEKVFESIPPEIHGIIEKISHIPCLDDYSDILRYILLKSTPSELSEICDITEGLENRILSFADCTNISEIISLSKTKRYTMTKLNRALLHIILDIKKSDISRFIKNGINEYIRVLGFRKASAHVLSQICRNSPVPVITSVKNADYEVLKKEIFASDLYALKTGGKKGSDFTVPLVVV